MTRWSLTKVKFFGLSTMIASGFISALAVFTTFDLDNQAKAIVVSGDPSDYLVKSGTGYDGVAELLLIKNDNSVKGCTGSLLLTGLHILTAAHCLTEPIFDANIGQTQEKFNTKIAAVRFESPQLLSTQRYQILGGEFYVHPNWNGNNLLGNDIAIIKLGTAAPIEIERYDIYRQQDELNQIVTIVGYGESGTGNTGANIEDILKRFGQNAYEANLGNILDASDVVIPDAAREQILSYDFDNGLEANDAFGIELGIPNTGLGLSEVKSTFGDSGGPGFINGKIAGIASSVARSTLADIDDQENSSFGEISLDTRVSSYSNYIDDVLAGNIEPTYKVPEPSTILGSVLALGALAINSRLKRTSKS